MKSKPAVLALTLLLGATSASAQTHTQTQAPGLWEHTFSIGSGGGESGSMLALLLQQQLAAMPPEQRKKIEAEMSSRGVTLGAQGTTMNFCLTKEQAARPPELRMTGDCTQSDVLRSANSMTFKFACTRPQALSGEGQVSFLGDKAYRGRSNVTLQIAGQPQQMAMALSGKWVGADCGAVQPVGTLPAR